MHGDKSFLEIFCLSESFHLCDDEFNSWLIILCLCFLGWEGVGLCSYFSIGFWYDRKFEKCTTSDAAKKAFVVNRIGDFGFLLGMFLIFLTFGSLNFHEVFSKAAFFGVDHISI